VLYAPVYKWEGSSNTELEDTWITNFGGLGLEDAVLEHIPG